MNEDLASVYENLNYALDWLRAPRVSRKNADAAMCRISAAMDAAERLRKFVRHTEEEAAG
jgi:hypothetical protein